MAIDRGATGGFAEGAECCPTCRRDGTDSLDGFEVLCVAKAGFGGEQGAGYMCPVIVCGGFQGLSWREVTV